LESSNRLIQFTLIAALCTWSVITSAQIETKSFQDGNLRCEYTLLNKQLDGNYVSYYRNGLKKAEGTFEHNCRVGVWSVWDSTGRLRLQRDYSNLFEYKQLFPVVSTDPPVALLNKPAYELTYNEKGFIAYFDIKERMVVWAKRVWRMITPEENPKLFGDDALYRILTKNIQSEKLNYYSAEDETFAKQLTQLPEPNNYKVIAYKLKEDTFFDNERLVSESRILGICPVAIDLKTKDTVDLYWIYFPHLRSCLATEIVPYESSDASEDILTFDNLFFFRHFYGEIYKESNVNDQPISAYTSAGERTNEIERIEISIIETEHDYWLQFFK